MALLKTIKQFFTGYTIVNRTNGSFKILAMTFEVVDAELYKRPGIHKVLLITRWDSYTSMCVILTNEIISSLNKFLEDAKVRSEAKLELPLFRYAFNLKFDVYQKRNKRRVKIGMGITKIYYVFEDFEISLAEKYLREVV